MWSTNLRTTVRKAWCSSLFILYNDFYIYSMICVSVTLPGTDMPRETRQPEGVSARNSTIPHTHTRTHIPAHTSQL